MIQRQLNTAQDVPSWMTHYTQLAYQALLCEVNLTPKPGLVDQHNNGAHRDMGLVEFHRSAKAIANWLPAFIQFGINTAGLSHYKTLCQIRSLGMQCEQSMFIATEGVNTHKGTIFAMGLLLAALGRLVSQQRELNAQALCAEVGLFCQGLVERELILKNQQVTAGQRLYQLYGLTGARGEAESGFKTVLAYALPTYRLMLTQGFNQEQALHQTLLQLIAVNPDTNIVARGGLISLQWIQQQAVILLTAGGAHATNFYSTMLMFDQACIERNLSPGGSADLLIITHFLIQLEDYPFID